MDVLLHSLLVRFRYGWHNICRSVDALSQSSLQYREIHTDLSTDGPIGKWTPDKVLLKFKPQILTITLQKVIKADKNIHIVDS